MTADSLHLFIRRQREYSQEFLASAALAADHGYYRPSVAEAYYAMFYLAEAVLATKDLHRSRHGQVISAFAEHFTNPGLLPRDLHTALVAAEKLRDVGHYHRQPTVTQEQAIEQLERARLWCAQVNVFLDRWLVEHPAKPAAGGAA